MARSSNVLAPAQRFVHRNHRIAFREYGAGEKVVVLTHGLLMDGSMFQRVAPGLAERGHRVITVDMLGHGESDQPYDMTEHSMTAYARDLVALLDHLNIKQAVVGGTSLGANVALEAAAAAPERVRGLVLEMPVLEHGLAGAAALFVPLALALRIGGTRVMGHVATFARRVPRTHFLVDLLIDFIRRDPRASLAVLDGITFGRVAPPREDRLRIRQPALIIGHPNDPIHPFSDADTLSHELPHAKLLHANSILEWRVRPARLDAALLAFLDDVWSHRE